MAKSGRNPVAAGLQAIAGTSERLATIPLRDSWAVSSRRTRVFALRTSAYVDSEMWLAGPRGDAEPSGLSGHGAAVREGHDVTIVTVSARNSGRVLPVLLFDHNNGRSEVLKGNFAPLLRSRYEGWTVLAGLIGFVGIGYAGVWLFMSGPRRRNPFLYLLIAAFACLALALQFMARRRARLTSRLEEECMELLRRLSNGEELEPHDIQISLNPPSASPPPAA